VVATARAGAAFHNGRGKLDHEHYVGGNKGRGPSTGQGQTGGKLRVYDSDPSGTTTF
jgi:hypothetical protein